MLVLHARFEGVTICLQRRDVGNDPGTRYQCDDSLPTGRKYTKAEPPPPPHRLPVVSGRVPAQCGAAVRLRWRALLMTGPYLRDRALWVGVHRVGPGSSSALPPWAPPLFTRLSSSHSGERQYKTLWRPPEVRWRLEHASRGRGSAAWSGSLCAPNDAALLRSIH